MSILRGEPGSNWTMPRGVEALRSAARQSGRPGLICLAGMLYQFVTFGYTFGATIAFPIFQRSMPELKAFEGVHIDTQVDFLEVVAIVDRNLGPAGLILILAPIALLLFRVLAGFARVCAPEIWKEARGPRKTPKLLRTWREGKGLTLGAAGLWVQVILMMLVAAVFFIGPVQLVLSLTGLGPENPLSVLLAGLAIALILVYSFLLSILFQIALHSLVQNRRGVGSALLHAWRIVKNDPGATLRATILDAVLYLTSFGLQVIGAILLSVTCVLIPLVFVWVFLVDGVTGCIRCSYWARVYRSLGGLTTRPNENELDGRVGL